MTEYEKESLAELRQINGLVRELYAQSQVENALSDDRADEKLTIVFKNKAKDIEGLEEQLDEAINAYDYADNEARELNRKLKKAEYAIRCLKKENKALKARLSTPLYITAEKNKKRSLS